MTENLPALIAVIIIVCIALVALGIVLWRSRHAAPPHAAVMNELARAQTAAAVARDYGGKAFDTLEALLAEARAVTVAVPTVHHLTVAEPCLRAGVACLIEKPLAKDVAAIFHLDQRLQVAQLHGGGLALNNLSRHAEFFGGRVFAFGVDDRDCLCCNVRLPSGDSLPWSHVPGQLRCARQLRGCLYSFIKMLLIWEYPESRDYCRISRFVAAPTLAVTAIASAPQKVTRKAPAVMFAPPTRAANPPSNARMASEAPETNGIRRS